MIKYTFREGEPVRIKGSKDADAQVIGEALAEICENSDGQLEPEDVVNAARKRGHVLHAHFEWDDTVAAESFRLDQARSLIRIVRVNDVNASEGTTRAFLSVTNNNGRAYHTVGEVQKSSYLQQAVLRQAESELAAFERRYKDLLDVCKLVSQARHSVKAKLKKLESHAAA